MRSMSDTSEERNGTPSVAATIEQASRIGPECMCMCMD